MAHWVRMAEPTYQERLNAERSKRLHDALEQLIVEHCGDSLVSAIGKLSFGFDDGTVIEIAVLAKKGANNFGREGEGC
jgi:hypothetical protein